MHDAAKLVRTQELMRYLLARYSLRECAKLMDLSYQTVRTWAKQPEFLAELKELSGEAWQSVSNELKVLASNVQERLIEESEQALNTLIEVMNDRTQKGIVRVKAAENILDRNAETLKGSKVAGSVDHNMKVDPMLLIHAAATGREVDDFKRKQLEGKTGE